MNQIPGACGAEAASGDARLLLSVFPATEGPAKGGFWKVFFDSEINNSIFHKKSVCNLQELLPDGPSDSSSTGARALPHSTHQLRMLSLVQDSPLPSTVCLGGWRDIQPGAFTGVL